MAGDIWFFPQGLAEASQFFGQQICLSGGLFATLGGWLKNVLFPNTSSKAYSIIILYPRTLFICVLLNSLSLQPKVRVHEGRGLVWLVLL